MARKLIAEFIGTFILVFFGVGSAVFAATAISPIGVALTFGFTLMVLVYTIGPISGCHVNPAVTVGVLLNKGITPVEAGGYVGAQLGGGLLAGLLLKLLTLKDFGGIADQTEGTLGTNTWSDTVTGGGAFIVEALLTMLLVFVVLQVTHGEITAANPGFAGLAIGSALAVVHFVGIPVTGTSVNPARSIGPAVFYWDNFPELWLFILAPLVGAALGWGLHAALGLATPRTRTRRTRTGRTRAKKAA